MRAQVPRGPRSSPTHSAGGAPWVHRDRATGAASPEAVPVPGLASGAQSGLKATTAVALAEFTSSMSSTSLTQASTSSLQASLRSQTDADYARTFAKLDAGAKLARASELKAVDAHHSRALRMSPSASMLASAMEGDGEAGEAGDHGSGSERPHSSGGGASAGVGAIRFGDLQPSKVDASILQRTYSSANFASFPLFK